MGQSFWVLMLYVIHTTQCDPVRSSVIQTQSGLEASLYSVVHYSSRFPKRLVAIGHYTRHYPSASDGPEVDFATDGLGQRRPQSDGWSMRASSGSASTGVDSGGDVG